MLKDAGASAVIAGHSERRQHHGETECNRGGEGKGRIFARDFWQSSVTARRNRSDWTARRYPCVADQIAASIPEGVTSSAIAIGYKPLWVSSATHHSHTTASSIVTSILLAVEDITGRRTLEREREELPKQKDLLLREMSHRVNNSLSIVANVLMLKAVTVLSRRNAPAPARSA